MATIRQQFEQRGFDQLAWQKAFHRVQTDYIRTRLRVIEHFNRAKRMAPVAKQQGIAINTAKAYLRRYIQGGLAALLVADQRPRQGALTAQQEQHVKQVLLHSRPADHQLGGNIWTGALMRQYIRQTYQVDYHSGIYDLLKRLGLTHQRAHADYGNASVEQQQACWQALETALLSDASQQAVLSFDEFSITEKPTTYYGWAEKNTRPVVVTDEKKVAV